VIDIEVIQLAPVGLTSSTTPLLRTSPAEGASTLMIPAFFSLGLLQFHHVKHVV
jgi:hypothetical protein